jgi:lactoylglutathione lyase
VSAGSHDRRVRLEGPGTRHGTGAGKGAGKDAGEPGYAGLRRGASELAVVASEWARDQYVLTPGDGPRFEMFVYTYDVDRLFADLRAEGVTVLRDPADMPCGERVAAVADPDGNPVTLGRPPSSPP